MVFSSLTSPLSPTAGVGTNAGHSSSENCSTLAATDLLPPYNIVNSLIPVCVLYPNCTHLQGLLYLCLSPRISYCLILLTIPSTCGGMPCRCWSICRTFLEMKLPSFRKRNVSSTCLAPSLSHCLIYWTFIDYIIVLCFFSGLKVLSSNIPEQLILAEDVFDLYIIIFLEGGGGVQGQIRNYSKGGGGAELNEGSLAQNVLHYYRGRPGYESMKSAQEGDPDPLDHPTSMRPWEGVCGSIKFSLK